MTTQSEKEFKAYHITYDFNHLNSKDDEPDDKHIAEIMEDKHIGINHKMPYLWVAEKGRTGKLHYHCYFHSSKSKNTVKTHMFNHTKEALSVTNPADKKYAKYDKDGVKGVEIYLFKGYTNHLEKTDDITIHPKFVLFNETYYGDSGPCLLDDVDTRAHKIRKMYEQLVTDLKKYNEHMRKISEENKLSEFQTILKDLEKKSLMTPDEIRSYLVNVHYMRPKYIFSEMSFKRIFCKILREKNEILYREYMNDRMKEIIRSSFNL